MRTTTYTDKLVLKVPEVVSEALEEIARRQLTSRSEYMRRALMGALERDGLCPLPRAA